MTGEEHLAQGTSHFVSDRDTISSLKDAHCKRGPGEWPGSCILGKVYDMLEKEPTRLLAPNKSSRMYFHTLWEIGIHFPPRGDSYYSNTIC